MRMSKFVAGLIILLIVLFLAGTASALPGDDRTVRDPPSVQAGERVPVFLVLNEQPKQPASFGELKANALSRQAQVLQTVGAVDSAAAKTARSYWIANAIWMEADPAALDQLARIPGVSRIEPDLTVTLSDPVTGVASTISPESISRPENGYATVWSVDYIEAPSVWKNGTIGEGVTIAIVDTGIEGDHPAFGDRVVKFADFVYGDNTSAYDDHGHGTHCAGTAAGGTVTVENYDGQFDVALGVAPGANLIGAKVLGSGGSGSFSTILSGAQWAVDNGADIVSMSLGTYVSRDNYEGGFYLSEGESRIVSLDVSSQMHDVFGVLYEPQFVIGSVRVEDQYYYATAAGYDPNPLESLTITITDGNGNIASGAEIDWLGFDQNTNRYYFKAPYASNTAGWNGFWKLNVTNTGETGVSIREAGLSECYQSNGETILDAAINNMVAGGTVVVIAAGNNGEFGTATIGTPGTAKDAITVGATDYLMDYRAFFSSMGPVNRAAPYIKPDVMAPGVAIISAYPGWQYASGQGTSMACPAVAGAAALMLSGNETLTPAEVKAALMKTAVHIGEDGAILPVMQKNNAYGAGRINAYEAVNTTGGLGEALPWNGIQHELIGGSLGYSVTGNTLPVMAVLWNTTAGEPLAGEEVELNVWYEGYYNFQYYRAYVDNQTLTTDEYGYAYYNADISTVPTSRSVYTRIASGSLQLEGSVWKNSVTPTPTVTPEPIVPIYTSETYRVDRNATVEIKYPLLAADGSPYVEDVAFTVENDSDTLVDEVLTPVNGVIAYSLDLAGRPLDETDLDIWVGGRYAGSVYVSQQEDISQHVRPFPNRAICLPGETVDLGIMAMSFHGRKTASQEFDVYVTTLTETEVLSLSSAGARTLSTPELGNMQALRAEVAGMKPETRMGSVGLTNGIGLMSFTMPEDGYIAIVRFVAPYEAMPMAQSPGEAVTVLVYGTLEPWLMHRSTPPAYEDSYNGTRTFVYATYDWPAVWDQSAYASVPADEATITACVYTYDPATVESDESSESGAAPGKTVYLYTKDGVQTGVTGPDGTCTFTVDTTDRTMMEYLLISPGVTASRGIWKGHTPFSLINGYSVNPGLIANRFSASAHTGTLYPDSEMRDISVIRDGDAYNVKATSYGPADELIHERGAFTFNRLPGASMEGSAGTEVATVVDFTGTKTIRVTPATKEYYAASYRLLNPNDQSSESLYYMFGSPEKSVSYTMPDSVLLGSSVPVVFNASTSDGAPIAGARVVLALGAASSESYGVSSFSDPRNENILLAARNFPDPYTVIANGYTDASGKVTLTFTAPNAGQQALREALVHASGVSYEISCYHDGEFVQAGYGYLGLTAEALPDFVPDISAPQIVKLERNDQITISNVALFISNIGTADYVYDSNNRMTCTAEVGPHSESTYFTNSLARGVKASVLTTTVSRNARDFGINTSDYRLPLDVDVGIEVNANRAVAELNYQNNRLVHPVRITAPDLAVEFLAPRYTTPAGITTIGVRVTNHGEVGSNAASLCYTITGKPEATVAVPALAPGQSTMIWQNQTLVAGEYTIDAEVNRAGATDYETTFTNNRVNTTIGSYTNPATKIELPRNLVLVPGTTYDLPITVNQVSDLAAYQVDLTFNGSVLAVQDVIPGALPLTAKNIGSGSVRFNGAAISGVSGNVTVATVRFNVVGKTGDETALNMVAGLWDANTLVIPAEVVSGDAYLLLYGDANGDGKVDQADTLKVLREVVGLDAKPAIGTTKFLQTDVTRNSAIEVGDAMFIAQYNVDLRDEYFRLK
ncbi:S8 family serine peptidase [Methanoculleus sp. Wushi-C6]|uniref:S8 family serine peptidase n=1 Tax=Methanoculleus caldifontis TaxID=2651577 RepID=A0ABU3X0C1_9EURY|nr:S8 family serine peptidase [Methanoculleus sp. Wushi-C6]MDV2481497.1 S8 family serine peptidase [Methanoculleus sp. Wushi-C6]